MKPCPRCGGERPRPHAKLCEDCRRIARLDGWRRRNERDRLPCSDCGGPKPPGRRLYCDECRDKRARKCCRCHARPPRDGRRLCGTCAAKAERRAKRLKLEWQRQHRPRLCAKCRRQPRRAPQVKLCAECHARTVESVRMYRLEWQRQYRARKRDARRIALAEAVRCEDGLLMFGALVPRAPEPALETLDAAPLAAFLRDVYPRANCIDLAARLRIDPRKVRKMMAGEPLRLSFAVIDRALTDGLGRPDLVDAIYGATLDALYGKAAA